MATNFNENSIVSSGGFKPSSKDTPLDIRTRVETEQDIYEIPNPYIGMIVYVKDTGKRFEILTLKEVDVGLTIKNVVDTYKQFTVDLEEYAKIEDVPTKVSELENDRGYAIEKNVDSKIETINNTINSNINNINTINSNINTINSEIDNINTNLIGVSESIEGSSILVDSEDGYLKDIEILGNTIQNQDNLADIRSVGDKVEGQELYEIPVLSRGKNLFNGILESGGYRGSTGVPYDANDRIRSKYKTKLKKGTYRVTCSDNPTTIAMTLYSDNVFVKEIAYTGTIYGFVLDADYEVNITLTTTNINTKIQLEEGTQATEYEPYQEDKLTILSPVQLEKVGDVADRIICKDGVWGVEKNIDTVILDGSDNFRYYLASSQPVDTALINIYVSKALPKASSSSSIISNRFTNNSETEVGNCYLGGGNNVHFVLSKAIIGNVTMFKSWLQENLTTLMYELAQPQFIPLPHDQQIKLRTFAGQTNIHFETEIEPTLKAQVPKSLGATVNSHTEQIGNLSKELDRVKKLEETVASEVVSESDFITVENTNSGYFSDIKLEGKTLILNADNEVVEAGTEGATLKSVGQDVDEISVLTTNRNLVDYLDETTLMGNGVLVGECLQQKKPNLTAVARYNVVKGKKYTIAFDIDANVSNNNSLSYCISYSSDYGSISNSKHINYRAGSLNERRIIKFTAEEEYVYFILGTSTTITAKNISLNLGDTDGTYTIPKRDKKRILYYNDETQTWEKPILRQWDSIEKHSDGKYYYHVRSEEVSYIEGDETKADHITDMTTTVKKLSTEKVYECTNLDLITYSGETNLLVKSGVLNPKVTLKIHQNITNIITILQNKVSILENVFIQGLKQVLAGDMQSLAYTLYPEDFENIEQQNDPTDK